MREKKDYKTYPCPTCGNYHHRGISVDAIIIKNDAILLIKRGKEPYKNLWALPGGHLDWNETLEDAVIREVKEETGLTVTSCKFFKIYSKPVRHPKQLVAVVYYTEVGGAPLAGDDAEDLQFFPLHALPEKLAFDHQQIIDDYLCNLKLG